MRATLLRRGLLALLILVPAEAKAQTAPDTGGVYPVDAATRVLSVDFRFSRGRSLPTDLLRETVALKDPRLFARFVRGLRGESGAALAAQRQLFDPAELVRDLERVRRLYTRSGFPDAQVDFELAVDAGANTVAVTYLIDEGRPLRVGPVTLQDTAGTTLPAGLPEDVASAWPSVEDRLDDLAGDRLSVDALATLEGRAASWFGQRGYPSAAASAAVGEPDADRRAPVRIQVRPGHRLRVDSIDVRGLERLDRGTILNEIDISDGGWVSTKSLAEGRREIMGLDLVRLAVLDVSASTDSTAVVGVDVEEGPLRLVETELGYASETGPSIGASWSHRNFWGGARTLTVDVLATTGQWALQSRPDRTYRLAVSIRQPRLFDRRVSVTTSTFGEISDGDVSRERLLGGQTTVVFVGSSALTLGLDLRVAHRWIDEYRIGAALQNGIDLLDLLTAGAQGALEDVGSQVREADIGLEATIGPGDRGTDLGFSWSLRPRVTTSAPSTLSDLRYIRFDLGAQARRGLSGGARLALRAAAGRVHAYGSSVPSDEDEELAKYLLLRRVLFTGGGSGDVRGWGTSQLGPKFPALSLDVDRDTLFIDAQSFTPLGGTDKLMVSAQAEAPLPAAPNWLAGLVFLDGGRIWTGDRRFDGDDPFGQDRFFWAAGGGFAVRSPVGRVEVALGVKLNPTVMDLADPRDVIQALVDGTPVEDVPTKQRRRLQLHLSVGVG